MKPEILTEQRFDCWYCGHVLNVTCKWKPDGRGYLVCPFCGGSDTVTNGQPVKVTDMETGRTVNYTNGGVCYESDTR